MSGQITRMQLHELENAFEYLSDQTFEDKLKEYTGITRTPYTGYSYFDANGNYLCDSDDFDLHVAIEDAYKRGYEDGKRDAVKHGCWEQGDYYDYGDVCLLCDWDSERDNCKWSYCPNCGAKMDGGADGE